MWPWGHLAVGYLLYAGYRRARGRGPPPALAVAALAVGTQFPDLIDKPLAWTVPLLPYGRSLAHTLFVAVPLSVGVSRWCRRRGQAPVGAAFAVGYLSHTLVDAAPLVAAGEFSGATYLLWPLLPVPEPTVGQSFLAHVANLSLTPLMRIELALTALALGVWVRDGTPGPAGVWVRVRERLRTSQP